MPITDTDHPRLHDVRTAVAQGAALRGLDPRGYALGHASFETRSDQRQLIQDHLQDRLRPRAAGPVSVLSVGCGDGAVDVVVAETLLDGPGEVRYVGVEPYTGSAGAFVEQMAALGPDLDARVHVTTLDTAPLTEETFDVVLFVHSMYYVPDVAATLRASYQRLRPGGELIVLSAPRGVLNRLAATVAPPVDGHPQWFSEEVMAGFTAAGVRLDTSESLDAVLDLTGADDEVLDFTTQARLTPEVRAAALAYLGAVALPAPTPGALLLPHPVDVLRSVRPTSLAPGTPLTAPGRATDRSRPGGR